MRTVEEVEAFVRGLDRDTLSNAERGFRKRAFDACLPRDFWSLTADDVTHNVASFNEWIVPYCEQIKMARKEGYGIAFFGPNGTGKTTFSSYVMQQALRARYEGFCTTSLRLEHTYRGARGERQTWARLDSLVMSDFLMLDELGKEAMMPSGESWGRAHIERILKDRADEKLPTIVVSNMSREDLERLYGRSVDSLLGGKFLIVTLMPGDFRPEVNKRMLAALKKGVKK